MTVYLLSILFSLVMVHEMKAYFSKNVIVIKVIVDGNGAKRPTQSTSEVVELEESELVEVWESKRKKF